MTADSGLIVIDEASSGLDEAGRAGLRRLIEHRREAGVAVVVSDHQDGWDWRESGSVWMESGTMTFPDRRRVVAQLVGPAENLDAIVRCAHAHDFVVH